MWEVAEQTSAQSRQVRMHCRMSISSPEQASAQDVDGKTFTVEADGLFAVCIQHEMDHLAGRLFIDYLSPLKREMVLKKLDKQRRSAASA